jgi:predicted nucleic-acid-binding Zn-ribbon protein
MKKLFNFIKKMWTHNYCDTCGYTKEDVYVTEIWMEAGLIQCINCYNETFKQQEQ